MTSLNVLVVVGTVEDEYNINFIVNFIKTGIQQWANELKSINVDDLLLGLNINSASHLEEECLGIKFKLIARCTTLNHACDNTTIQLVSSPTCLILRQSIATLLTTPSEHSLLVFGGHFMDQSSGWCLQDGLYSVQDFNQLLTEERVKMLMGKFENSLTISCGNAEIWRENLESSLKIQVVDPILKQKQMEDKSNPLSSPSLNKGFQNLTLILEDLLSEQTEGIFNQLEPPLQEGQLRTKNPCLYVMPGGKGDSAFFVCDGFNILLNGGSLPRPWFWKLLRHQYRLDCIIATHLDPDSLNGINSFLLRKAQEKQIHLPMDNTSREYSELSQCKISPDIGMFFMNVPDNFYEHVLSRGSQSEINEEENEDKLAVKTTDVVKDTLRLTRALNIEIEPLTQQITPITVFYHIGIGKLDIYVLSPSEGTMELKYIKEKWGLGSKPLMRETGVTMPNGEPGKSLMSDLASISCLLVFHPKANKDKIIRILFPGNAPQTKILEGLEKINHLDFLKIPTPTQFILDNTKGSKSPLKAPRSLGTKLNQKQNSGSQNGQQNGRKITPPTQNTPTKSGTSKVNTATKPSRTAQPKISAKSLNATSKNLKKKPNSAGSSSNTGVKTTLTSSKGTGLSKTNTTPSKSKVEPSKSKVETSKGKAEPSKGKFEPPKGKAEPSKGKVQPIKGKVEPSKGKVEPTKGKVEPSKSKVEPTKKVVAPKKAAPLNKKVFPPKKAPSENAPAKREALGFNKPADKRAKMEKVKPSTGAPRTKTGPIKARAENRVKAAQTLSKNQPSKSSPSKKLPAKFTSKTFAPSTSKGTTKTDKPKKPDDKIKNVAKKTKPEDNASTDKVAPIEIIDLTESLNESGNSKSEELVHISADMVPNVEQVSANEATADDKLVSAAGVASNESLVSSFELVSNNEVDDEPVNNEEPVVNNEPGTSSELLAHDEIVISSKLVNENEPDINSEVVTKDEPDNKFELSVDNEPIIRSELITNKEPVTNSEFLTSDEPVAHNELVTSSQLFTKNKPDSSNELTTEDEQATNEELVASDEPVTSSMLNTNKEPDSSNELITEDEQATNKKSVASDEPVTSSEFNTNTEPDNSNELFTNNEANNGKLINTNEPNTNSNFQTIDEAELINNRDMVSTDNISNVDLQQINNQDLGSDLKAAQPGDVLLVHDLQQNLHSLSEVNCSEILTESDLPECELEVGSVDDNIGFLDEDTELGEKDADIPKESVLAESENVQTGIIENVEDFHTNERKDANHLQENEFTESGSNFENDNTNFKAVGDDIACDFQTKTSELQEESELPESDLENVKSSDDMQNDIEIGISMEKPTEDCMNQDFEISEKLQSFDPNTVSDFNKETEDSVIDDKNKIYEENDKIQPTETDLIITKSNVEVINSNQDIVSDDYHGKDFNEPPEERDDFVELKNNSQPFDENLVLVQDNLLRGAEISAFDNLAEPKSLICDSENIQEKDKKFGQVDSENESPSSELLILNRETESIDCEQSDTPYFEQEVLSSNLDDNKKCDGELEQKSEIFSSDLDTKEMHGSTGLEANTESQCVQNINTDISIENEFVDLSGDFKNNNPIDNVEAAGDSKKQNDFADFENLKSPNVEYARHTPEPDMLISENIQFTEDLEPKYALNLHENKAFENLEKSLDTFSEEMPDFNNQTSLEIMDTNPVLLKQDFQPETQTQDLTQDQSNEDNDMPKVFEYEIEKNPESENQDQQFSTLLNDFELIDSNTNQTEDKIVSLVSFDDSSQLMKINPKTDFEQADQPQENKKYETSESLVGQEFNEFYPQEIQANKPFTDFFETNFIESRSEASETDDTNQNKDILENLEKQKYNEEQPGILAGNLTQSDTYPTKIETPENQNDFNPDFGAPEIMRTGHLTPDLLPLTPDSSPLTSDPSQDSVKIELTKFDDNDHTFTLVETSLPGRVSMAMATDLKDVKVNFEDDGFNCESSSNVETGKSPCHTLDPMMVQDGVKATTSAKKTAKPTSQGSAFYFDLAYIPHHANQNSVGVEFFERIRSKYYVVSGIDSSCEEPNENVLNFLLDGKQTWENSQTDAPSQTVTVIPTHNSPALHAWYQKKHAELEGENIHLVAAGSKVMMHNEMVEACKIEF